MKKYLLGIISLAILMAAALWWLERESTLAELQKQYLLAKTQADSAKVVERLEKYYLNLSIPDTIRQRVESEVAAQVDTTKITVAEVAPDTNVYRLEAQLQDVLRLAAIARARDENQTFQNLIRQAKAMAKTVDAGTQNNYWAPVVDGMNTFKKEKAFNWLKAIKAENLCRLYHNNINKIADAERYATLGLNLLQKVEDERVYLDIIQRLQWILYFHHSMYELSIALAQKVLPQADKIKYHLRSNALIFVQAETFLKMGQNQTALAFYDTVFRNAKKFRQINDMELLSKRSLMGKGEVYRELGDFEKSWSVCREAARLPLNQTETIKLQHLKFNVLKATGHYEQAEEELKKAISLATRPEDLYKRINYLNDLGALYAGLTDHDLALAYYKQAQSLFTPYFPDVSTRLLVLTNIAYMLAIKNDSTEFEKISKEAQRLVKLTSSPYLQALLLFNIGDWNQANKKHNAAIKYYHQADSIAYQNGFLRFALMARMDIVDCMIALSRFHEVKALIAGLESLAEEIGDFQGLIHAHARAAQIHYREGNLMQAVESSNQLLHEIEEMSSRFNNSSRLITYRQKIYSFLKNSVLYDIAFNNNESAFAKLDHAKAYALKSRLANNYNNDHRHETNGKKLNLDSFKIRLQPRQLLLDYMMMPDTLYVFVLDQDGLRLLRKNIDIEALQKTVNAYKDSINKTFRSIQADNSDGINAHYANTAVLGQRLYEELLGWPEIESRLQHTNLLYVIPDEFLYELPFSTLRANRSDVQTFLVNRAAVLTLPSASLLRSENHAGAAPSHLKTMKVLVSADKRFPGADKFVAKAKALFPLAEELMVQDSAFTKDKVLAQLQKDYQAYIFVGHGQANSQYPDQGYIELSVKTPKAPATKIVRLAMADLKTINWLAAEMVMLVGCETVGRKLYRGTGISGLQQEFLSLGVKNVLGNLWEVDATHAILQAQDFLTTWAMTGDPLRALRESQLKAVQRLQGHRYYQQPHPYFWGSSVLATVQYQ